MDLKIRQACKSDYKKIELLTQKDDEILSNLQNLKMIGVDNIESNANNVVSTRKSSGTTTKSSK